VGDKEKGMLEEEYLKNKAKIEKLMKKIQKQRKGLKTKVDYKDIKEKEKKAGIGILD